MQSKRIDVLIIIGSVCIALLGFVPQVLFSTTSMSYGKLQSMSFDFFTHPIKPGLQNSEYGFRLSRNTKFFDRVFFEFDSDVQSSQDSFFLALNLPSRSIWIPASHKLYKRVLVVKIDAEIQAFLTSLNQDTLDILQNVGLSIRLAQVENLPTEMEFSEQFHDVKNSHHAVTNYESIFMVYRESEITACPAATITLCSLQNSSLSSLDSIFDKVGQSSCARSSDAGILTIYEPLFTRKDLLSVNFVSFTQRNYWHCPSDIQFPYKSSETYLWFNPMVQFHGIVEFSKV